MPQYIYAYSDKTLQNYIPTLRARQIQRRDGFDVVAEEAAREEEAPELGEEEGGETLEAAVEEEAGREGFAEGGSIPFHFR